MTLYEINTAMLELVDDETGEISDFESFMELQMERMNKIENIALWHKNLLAEGEMIKAEEAALKARREVCERKAKRLKEYLSEILDGEKFKTARVDVNYRKSTVVELDEGFVEWAREYDDSYLRFKEPEPAKSLIKKALADGERVPHARLIEKQNIIIK